MKKLQSATLLLIFVVSALAKKERKDQKQEEKKENNDEIAYAVKDLNVAGCLVNLNGNYYDLSPLQLDQTE